MIKNRLTKWILVSIFGISVFSVLGAMKAEAVENRYESNTGVGFYGEYEPLEKEDPVKEAIVEEPPTAKSLQKTSGNEFFPQTGVKVGKFSGFGYVLFSIGLFSITNKKMKRGLTK